MKKWVISILVFLISFTLLAFLGLFLAIFIAGPHSDVLPEFMASPIFFILLFVVFAIPVWLAYKVYQKLSE